MNNRLYFYDNAKYYLILSVILGHLLQNNGLSDRWAVGIFDTIFMFAMPTFVFISGLFTPPQLVSRRESRTNIKFWLSELSLVETMFFFSLIMKLPDMFTTGLTYYTLIVPGYTLWYLLALVWWRLLVHILPGVVLKHKVLSIVVSILISFFSGFLVRGDLIALPRTLFFLPFFVAGSCLSDRREQIVTTINRIPIVASLITIIIIVGINIWIGYNQLPFNTGNISYYRWEMALSQALLWRVIFSILCVSISVAVLRIIPNKQTYVSEYGAKTIILYVYHAVILFYLNVLFRQFSLPTNTYIACAEFLAIVLILMLITNSRIANFLISPITKAIKSKIKV